MELIHHSLFFTAWVRHGRWLDAQLTPSFEDLSKFHHFLCIFFPWKRLIGCCRGDPVHERFK